VLKNASEFEKSRIFGMIFLSKFYPRQLDDTISNETEKFKTPEMLSISLISKMDIFANYSWNTMNDTA